MSLKSCTCWFLPVKHIIIKVSPILRFSADPFFIIPAISLNLLPMVCFLSINFYLNFHLNWDLSFKHPQQYDMDITVHLGKILHKVETFDSKKEVIKQISDRTRIFTFSFLFVGFTMSLLENIVLLNNPIWVFFIYWCWVIFLF